MNNPDSNLYECQKRINYRFKDVQLLQKALTHSSYASTHEDSYERLEFLGDSVLGLVIAEILYMRFPQEREGDLSLHKGSLVSRKTCSKIVKSLGLDEFILYAGGADALSPSMTADLMESIIGAIYLDAGLKQAALFIEQAFADEIDRITDAESIDNYKALLQNLVQSMKPEPRLQYKLLDEKGPPHCRCFKIAVMLNGTMYQAAWGSTKKETEQRAAENALSELQGKEPPHVAGD